MYELAKSYGKRTYDTWKNKKPKNLRGTQTSPEEAKSDVWEVTSFRQLLGCVAFLTSMNKRSTLFFRGQTSDEWEPLPALFRSEWRCFDFPKKVLSIEATRKQYWNELPDIGRRVYEICKNEDLGLPRRRGLRDIREVQWAIIQHYGLWPTPLIDITSSLRIAASFAMGLRRGSAQEDRSGFVFVVGMPSSTGSITFDIDQHLCLARLHSACPPVAVRPHYQDGFLVGRVPIYSMNDRDVAEKSNLLRRLVAKFKLIDEGKFWDKDFPIISRAAVYPKDDPLRNRLLAEFGRKGKYPLWKRAASFDS